MAQTGHTAIFACFEHDEITLLTRLLACELGEAIAASETLDEIRLDALREGLRAVSTGTASVREVLDSDPLLRRRRRVRCLRRQPDPGASVGHPHRCGGAWAGSSTSTEVTAPHCSWITCRRCR